MGLLTNRVEMPEIKPGDHIYTWRAVFSYSHHGLLTKCCIQTFEHFDQFVDGVQRGLSVISTAGIFVGGSKVVHFTPEREANSSHLCSTSPDCGFSQPNSGVVISCLNCFLRNGSLYCFEYGVTLPVFLAKVRGGTCTIAQSDPSQIVIHRAMYLLQNGFGNYDVFENNCEDFALYCKTGLLIMDRLGVGRSGQASSVIGAPLAALLTSPLKLLLPSPIAAATVTAGMYCMSRYATDIGVRTDVLKVAVEDLAVNLGWEGHHHEELADTGEASIDRL